jgi:TRAP-type transport system periplasmic protein
MASQLRASGLDPFLCTGQLVSTLVPSVSVYGVSYAFTTYDEVWHAMDGRSVRLCAPRPPGEACTSWTRCGTRASVISPPIRTPADLQGRKIRIPVSPLWTSTFTALGAEPVSIPFADVYTALQTHIVDGQDASLSGLETAKFYEVVKYCSLTRHMWEGFLLLANHSVWQSLPPDLQEILARNFKVPRWRLVPTSCNRRKRCKRR